MNLAETIYMMNQKSQNAAQLTDLRIGTVVSVSPLEISINSNMPPLQSGVLLLTTAVVEKKIPVVQHSHIIHDTYTGYGTCEDSLGHIICYENGQALPVKNGYIIFNRALEVGDKVLLLRVQSGQKFIVLSRVF